MPQVVGVGFRYTRTLLFDPNGLSLAEGDSVIVETERGEEIGVVCDAVFDVAESEIEGELKPVIRVATADDLIYAQELGEKEKEAFEPFREYIAKNELEMKPIDIEYLFGGDKIVFYFSSENRVDFRQLVKDLATHFHMRIDMRQMGSRDQARMVGGLGRCGDELCCARFPSEFEPVSIRMAKDQGLPPNPTKISGACGRLMCCLRYEVEAYQDFSKRAPKKGAVVKTPKGSGEVVELDALHETVKLRFRHDEDTKPEILEIPLQFMRCALGNKCKGHGVDGSCCAGQQGNDCPRPCEVTKKAFTDFERSIASDDLFTPFPVVFKKKTETSKISSGERGGQTTDAPAIPSRKERKGNRNRRTRPAKESNTSTETQKQSAQGSGRLSSQGRKRRPNKSRDTATRRAAVVSKGDGGTEATVRQAKRVPRRRSQQ